MSSNIAINSNDDSNATVDAELSANADKSDAGGDSTAATQFRPLLASKLRSISPFDSSKLRSISPFDSSIRVRAFCPSGSSGSSSSLSVDASATQSPTASPGSLTPGTHSTPSTTSPLFTHAVEKNKAPFILCLRFDGRRSVSVVTCAELMYKSMQLVFGTAVMIPIAKPDSAGEDSIFEQRQVVYIGYIGHKQKNGRIGESGNYIILVLNPEDDSATQIECEDIQQVMSQQSDQDQAEFAALVQRAYSTTPPAKPKAPSFNKSDMSSQSAPLATPQDITSQIAALAAMVTSHQEGGASHVRMHCHRSVCNHTVDSVRC